LRAICGVKAFAKVLTFAADFALHLIPQKASAAVIGVIELFCVKKPAISGCSHYRRFGVEYAPFYRQ